MTQQERQGWLIVASLFFVLLLVFGSGYNTVAVFVPALLRAFPRWSRAEVALLPSLLALSAGVSVLPIGWLLDRVEARLVMVFGAAASGSAFLIASRASSLFPMIAAYLLLGVGISAATVLPASLVLANLSSGTLSAGDRNSCSISSGSFDTDFTMMDVKNQLDDAALLLCL